MSQAKKFTAVKITRETNTKLKIYCASRGLMMSFVAEQAILKYVEDKNDCRNDTTNSR